MKIIEAIDLYPIQEYCWACGVFVIPLRHGLPVYEDEILPNDWQGEWGGVPSCPECYEVQGLLTEPMPAAQFRKLRGAKL